MLPQQSGDGEERRGGSSCDNNSTDFDNKRSSSEATSDRDHRSDSASGDVTRTLMEGWMDKCVQNLMMSRWTHRWCVLNGNSFIYYIDESKTVQKGAYVIDDTCRVSTEDSSGDKRKSVGRDQVLMLQRPGNLSGGGYQMMLSGENLQRWESALSSVIATLRQKKEAEAVLKKAHAPRLSIILDTIIDATTGSPPPPEGGEGKRTLEKRPSFFRRRSTLKPCKSGSGLGLASAEVPVDPTALLRSALKDGRVLKRGNGESEYSEDFCVLSPASMCFFADSSMQESRGEVVFDATYYLTRLTADKKQKSTNNSHFLSLQTRGTGKNITTKTSDLLLSFPSQEQQVVWEDKIYKVLYEHARKVHDGVVRVQLYHENDGGTVKIDEPIFKISLLVDSTKAVLEQCHHYADIREVYLKLKPLSSGIITAAFPRALKRSNFNIKLTEEEIENRIVGLQTWLQDLVSQYSKFDYLNFIGQINDVQVDIAALFGTEPRALKLCIKEAREKKQLAGAPPPLPLPLPTSKMMSLFQQFSEEESGNDNGHDGNGNGNGNGGGGGGGALPSASASAPPAEKEAEEDTLRMPSSPDKLALYSLLQLAALCKTHQMDCTDFKSKKNYISALATTYQKALPYLHNKEARPIVERLLQTLEYKPSSINDDAVNIEIDKIFIDLMRKLGVEEGLLGLLSMEYNSFEKLDRIKACVSIWDADLFFTPEDSALLQQFTSDRYLDSFAVLNLKSRLSRCVTESDSTWLHRWCVLRGLPALVARVDTLVEQAPLMDVDAVNLLRLLQVFRAVVVTDCRYELVATRGAIEALVMTVRFEFKALAIESLNLLAELIIFGGPDAVWQMINAFKHLAYLRNEEFLAILVDGIMEQDITVQCPILSLVNSVLLYEGDINSRIKIRSRLHALKFEDICTIFKKEYARVGKVAKPQDGGAEDAAGGSHEDQIRDKIDRLLFGGSRKLKQEASAASGGEEDPEYFQENCRKLQLRPGVEISEFDFGPSLAEDFDTGVHPEMGVMEGHIVCISKKSDADDESDLSWEGVVKNVARRLSMSEPKAPPPPDDVNKYERNWYELHDNILSWFNLADKTDSFRERAGALDISRVIDILDYSSLATKVKVPQQNMFSLVLCDEEDHHHFYLDCMETKHKWMLAIRVVQKRMALRKCAFRLPPSPPLESTATLKLQKEFDYLYSIYETVAKEDVSIMYSTAIADAIDPAGSLPPDPVSLVRFIDLELRKNRNAAKLKQLMSEIAEFVNVNYAPKEEEPAEEDEEEVKIIHPLAVPHSDRPIAQAPNLPFIPAEKTARVPGKKVKQLFWTKVKPVNVWKSVWEGMEEPELAWTSLDEQFGEVVRRRKAFGGSTTHAPVDTKPKAVSLFDGKRTQNAAIACGKLRKSPEEIFDMIVNLDPEELTQEINETILLLLLPTDEEIAALRAYTGKVEDLDFCGRLFSYLTEIERLEPRLRVQHVMLGWNEEARVVFDQLNIVKLALEELKDPEALESFELTLSCVLAAGNYMNGKTSRGQAHGFKLDILPKLRNIKQVSFGKKTFLHFIIGQCQTHFPDHKAFYESWHFMWKSPKVVLKNLENILTELQSNLNVCVEEIEAAEAIESEQCRVPLVESLGAFITQASDTLQELNEQFAAIDKDVRFVKNYFGESSVPAALTSHDDDPWCSFFSLFVNFANMHRLSSVELQDWEKADERIRKNAAARQAKMSSAPVDKPPSSSRSARRAADADSSALCQQVPVERVSSIDSTSSGGRRGSRPGSVGEGESLSMIDMFKRKMLVIRKTADVANDEGGEESDDSDDGGW